MFMALATSSLNALAVVIGTFIESPKASQALLAAVSLLSPFLAIYLLRFYIKIAHPAELIRQISALEASIAICKSHLKDKNASDEFKQKTRRQMEKFQTQLQNIRSTFEAGRTHVTTSIDSNSE